MIDRATFDQQVREALAHIYDPRYLQGHPLAEMVNDSIGESNEKTISSMLIDAIEQLRPPDHVQREAPSWRRYLAVALRYRDGLSPERVAHELKLSERQARRDHQDGVEGVAAILWSRLMPSSETTLPSYPDSSAAPSDIGSTIETELLKLSRTEGAELVDLWATLQGALSLVGSLAASQSVDLDVRGVETPVSVAMNRTALRQILVALLSHAIEHWSGSRMLLTITGTSESAVLCIEVKATGSTPHQSLLTEAKQLWSVAHNLAELHGATLETRADETHGAVILTMPARPVVKVLLIDDSADFLRLFRRYLADSPYRLSAARTPDGALRLATEARPDVIILDVLMPTHDGWEVLAMLKSASATQGVPVIVCSVLPERALALSLGVAEFLPKPVTQASLLATLERVVGGSTMLPLPRASLPPR